MKNDFQAGTASIYFKPQGALRNNVKLPVSNCTDKNSTFQAVLPCENHTILFPCNFFDNPLCTDEYSRSSPQELMLSDLLQQY